jgi:hypothetical protein
MVVTPVLRVLAVGDASLAAGWEPMRRHVVWQPDLLGA